MQRSDRVGGSVVNAIETTGLTRLFDGRVAVEDLSLAVPAGTVFGFLGPNGAGKTTTVRMLAGLIRPTSGDAIVAGHRLGTDGVDLRGSVGILTEAPGLYDRLSARQNLTYFARLYDLSRAAAEEQVERYLGLLGLWERRDDPVGTFSKGTHNLPEADELCDTIAVFERRLLRVGTPTDLRASLFGDGTLIRVVGDASAYLGAVRAIEHVRDVEAEGDTLRVRIDDPDEANPALIEALRAVGARIRYVERWQRSLEDVYLTLVREERT